jgi:hypothetical protein
LTPPPAADADIRGAGGTTERRRVPQPSGAGSERACGGDEQQRHDEHDHRVADERRAGSRRAIRERHDQGHAVVTRQRQRTPSPAAAERA